MKDTLRPGLTGHAEHVVSPELWPVPRDGRATAARVSARSDSATRCVGKARGKVAARCPKRGADLVQ